MTKIKIHFLNGSNGDEISNSHIDVSSIPRTGEYIKWKDGQTYQVGSIIHTLHDVVHLLVSHAGRAFEQVD